MILSLNGRTISVIKKSTRQNEKGNYGSVVIASMIHHQVHHLELINHRMMCGVMKKTTTPMIGLVNSNMHMLEVIENT